jgi:hypothetical protein
VHIKAIQLTTSQTDFNFLPPMDVIFLLLLSHALCKISSSSAARHALHFFSYCASPHDKAAFATQQQPLLLAEERDAAGGTSGVVHGVRAWFHKCKARS